MKNRNNSPLSAQERKRIRAARLAKGLSMQALSKSLFRHRGAVEAVESGRRTPTPDLLRDLYAALEIEAK